MFSKNTEDENPYWISFTDLMSGFMVIFILISLFLFAKESEIKEDPLKTKYAELVEIFRWKFSKIPEIQVADDATIRFLITQDSATTFFPEGEETFTPYCQSVLDKFIPIYYQEIQQVLNNDSFQIREIRIEGHTNSVGNYLENLSLSSGRALKVQEYILGSLNQHNFPDSFSYFIQKNSIACGYSFSYPLDSLSNRTENSRLSEDLEKSRRVEFRIMLESKYK